MDPCVDVPGLRLSEPEPGIVELLIDRPERRNALTEEMMVALATVVEQVNAREDIGVLLLRGSGGAFCAGADLGVVSQRRRMDVPWRWPALMGREAELLEGCEVATIAVVDGAAVGLGMGLALSCDICVIEPSGLLRGGPSRPAAWRRPRWPGGCPGWPACNAPATSS